MLVHETPGIHRTQTHAKVMIDLGSRPEYLNCIDLLVRNEGLDVQDYKCKPFFGVR